jgi:hypothetical protein
VIDVTPDSAVRDPVAATHPLEADQKREIFFTQPGAGLPTQPGGIIGGPFPRE